MGSEICQSGYTETNELPDHLNPELKQKLQMSTAVPHENGSSNNDLFRSELNKEEEKPGERQERQEREEKSGFQSCKATLHSVARLSPVRYDQMQVITPQQKRKRINQFEVNAPFKVILLTISSGLKHTINEVGHDLFQKYYQQSATPGWKLHKNGYYVNYLAKKLTAILTEQFYYEGQLVQDDSNRILPKANGILLNEFGRYEGNFEMGKAHGKGLFENRIKKAVYKGIWENGKLVDGIIQSTQYRFKGQIHDNMAHGNGSIYFKQTEVSYEGKFKKGLYYDKEAIYETKDYIYEGCFINGKKNGEGTLVEKQRNYSKKQTKYRPPCQFEGSWTNDVYLNKRTLDAIMNQNQTGKDPETNPDQSNKAPHIMQQIMFEEEEETVDQKSNRKVGKGLPDEELNLMKPKFVWVDIPKPQKKKKKAEDEDDEDSQVF